MTEMTRLGMTDVASRSGLGRSLKLGLAVLLLVFIYAFLRNAYYLQQGMLAPDFDIIHAAYDFNLFELPLVLLVMAVLFSGLAVTWLRSRKVLLWFAALYAFLAFDLFVLRYYVTYIEPERLVLRSVRLETPKLDQAVRILHISDIQAGSIGAYERSIFKKIEALKPDLILNTGDFLQEVPPASFESELPELLELIAQVNPRFGTYAVFGDVELEMYRVPAERLKPLEFLSSRSAAIDTGSGMISVHGLSLYQSKKAKWAQRSIEPWLEESSPEAFRILMGHSPDYAMGVGDMPIDLCLAGHTHGGQVQLPWVGPLTIYSEVPKAWARGFRRIGVPYLNVSAGAGSNRRNGLPPIRFNCPTEMTLIELVPLRSLR